MISFFYRKLLITGVLLIALSGCAAGGGGNATAGDDQDTPEPTPAEVEDVGEESVSGAAEGYQETWENYLRDSIAEQVSDRQQKLSILQRYEDPDITEQNLGGHVQDIDLIEGGDRTQFNLNASETVASANADFDIQITYANGDVETRTCRPAIQLNFNAEDNKWYVLNPAELQVFAVCAAN